MKPTEVLKEEHRAIKIMLDVLENVSEKLRAGGKVSPEHLNQIVDFIRTFADKCHHGKEQDLLFPAMEAAGIPREGGPIGVMLEEHELGRSYVRSMAKAIEEYISDNKKSGINIAENAMNYVNLLRQHIDKEDNILYMMADMHLSGEKQNELLAEFGKFEKEKMGVGIHEKYHKLLHQLKDIYAK